MCTCMVMSCSNLCWSPQESWDSCVSTEGDPLLSPGCSNIIRTWLASCSWSRVDLAWTTRFCSRCPHFLWQPIWFNSLLGGIFRRQSSRKVPDSQVHTIPIISCSSQNIKYPNTAQKVLCTFSRTWLQNKMGMWDHLFKQLTLVKISIQKVSIPFPLHQWNDLRDKSESELCVYGEVMEILLHKVRLSSKCKYIFPTTCLYYHSSSKKRTKKKKRFSFQMTQRDLTLWLMEQRTVVSLVLSSSHPYIDTIFLLIDLPSDIFIMFSSWYFFFLMGEFHWNEKTFEIQIEYRDMGIFIFIYPVLLKYGLHIKLWLEI